MATVPPLPITALPAAPPATANETTSAPTLIPAPPAPTANETPKPAPPTSPRVSVAVALTDMTASDRYKGEDGGLYGKGLNAPPKAHQEAAMRELAKILPLDALGNPSAKGKVVLISIGMSNTTQEFSVFKRLADADPDKSPNLVIVDGAQGGQTARTWATQQRPWQILEEHLQRAGVTPEQVQVVWAKHADAQPREPFPASAKELQTELAAIMRLVKEHFPNVRVVYLSSRIYGGYATTSLNPEPFAYESAFSVRWLIQEQMDGAPALNFDPDKGPVVSPLLLWGPYLWADGLNPRSDGLIWERGDFTAADGTHPSDRGRDKVARMLLNFFKTDDLARTWFAGRHSDYHRPESGYSDVQCLSPERQDGCTSLGIACRTTKLMCGGELRIPKAVFKR